jgi:hypothetical protein
MVIVEDATSTYRLIGPGRPAVSPVSAAFCSSPRWPKFVSHLILELAEVVADPPLPVSGQSRTLGATPRTL